MPFLIRFAFKSIALSAFFLVVTNTSWGQDRPPSSSDERGAGWEATNSDDPIARDNFEWLRLRDPATGMIPARMREKELAFAALLPHREMNGALIAKGTADGIAAASPVWHLRGPNNVGGRTRALAVDVANESVILAGGISGSMFRSNDAGVSWVSTTPPQQLHNVSCVSQDRRSGHTNTWYYGTGEFRGSSADGGYAGFLGNGIYKSTDDGMSWNSLVSTASNTPQSRDNSFDYVFNIATNPAVTTRDEVYAAAFGTISRSINGGNSWTTVKGGNSSNSNYTDVAVTPQGVIYATLSSGGSDGGLWRSTDGSTWVNITPPGYPSPFQLVVIGIAPSNPNIVYFYGDAPGVSSTAGSLWKYTYLSGDGTGAGGQWDDRTPGMPTDLQLYSSYCMIVAVKPDDPNTIFLGGLELYRSTDGFATRTNTSVISGSALHADQHSFAFLPSDPNILYIGNDGGVFVTTGASDFSVQWTAVNTGYLTTQFYSCAIDHASTSQIVIGGLQDNGTHFTDSNDPSTPWKSIWGSDGCACAIADNASYYYVSTQNGEIYRLSLGPGGFQIDYTKVNPIGGNGYLFVNPFTLDPVDTRMMYLPTGIRLWRNSDLTTLPAFGSQNTSTNWTELTQARISSGTFTAVAASHAPAHRVYCGTDNGQVYRIDNADAGNPASMNIYAGKNLSIGYVSCIAIDPANADDVIVVFSNYNIKSLFRSTNGGASWVAIGGNLEADTSGSGDGPSCRWLSILPVGTGRVYLVGTSTGLYSTTILDGDNTSWTLESPSLIGNLVVDMIDTRAIDGHAVAATHGAGMYSTNFTALPLASPPLISPANNRKDIARDTTASWQTVSGVFAYRIQISTDPTFATSVIDVADVTTTSYHFSGLAQGTLYYWRVQSADASGAGPWSAVWRFTTHGPSGVNTPNAMTLGYELGEAIPNPVEVSASIPFTIPHGTDVTLSVFDPLGRNVQTLASGKFEQGNHTILMNTAQLLPGVYFYRLVSKDATLTKQFTILR